MTAAPDMSHLDSPVRNAGALAEGDRGAGALLRSAGALLAAAREKVLEASGPPPGTVSGTEMTFTARASRALDRAIRFAFHDRTAAVGTVHVLLGILDVEGTACQVLRGLDVDVATLRTAAEVVIRDGVSGALAKPHLDVPAPAKTLVAACPACGAALEGSLAYCRLPASTPAGEAHEFGVAYCGNCSGTLGVWPEQPTGWGTPKR